MKELDKILLVHKVLTKKASLDEVALLDSLANESGENQELINDIERVWAISNKIEKEEVLFDKNKAKNRLFAEINKSETKTIPINSDLRNSHKSKFFKKMISIAAIFIVVLGAFFLINNILNSEEILKSGDFVSQYKLSDNSVIWLDKNSRLKIGSDFNNSNRLVTLIGSAYFDIERNEKLPFTIKVGDAKVQVLGTSFQVYSNTVDKVGVNVYSGKVKFSNSFDESILLLKGEGAELDTRTNSFKKLLSPDFENDIRASYLTFDDAQLSDVFGRLKSYFDIKIDIVCDDIYKMKGYTSPGNAGDDVKAYFETIEKLYKVNIIKVSDNNYKVDCKDKLK